jgi:hypothetical protein
VVAVLALAAAVPGTVLAAKAWQVSASPSTIYVSTSTAVRVTVTNTGDDKGGDEISCVRITVPSSFTISSVGVSSVHGQTSGAAYSAWVAVWTGGSTVAFKEPQDDYPLVGSTPPIDEAVFRITGTSTSLLAMSWTAEAFDHSDGKANTTACGSGSFTSKTLAFVVLPLPTPTPTPTPTPAPTPTPTPTPTAKPVPTPTTAPGVTPRPSATAPSGQTPAPGTTAGPSASPTLESPAPDSSLEPGASLEPTASPTPDPGSTPQPIDPGATVPPGGGPVAGGGGFAIGGSSPGSDDGSGDAEVPVQGIDGAVASVLAELPGGVAAFAGPALVLSVPGLLVILAVGAQAFGALAWLPIARRKLGGFGIRGSRSA